MSNQDQKAIFITGSSSGLGRATAKLFAAKEWKVIASIGNADREKELAKISGVVLMSLDVTDPPKSRVWRKNLWHQGESMWCSTMPAPDAPAFAAGTEMVTESGCVQTGVPLVKSRRCMVIFSLP